MSCWKSASSLALTLILVGCEPAAPPAPPAKSTATEEHGHSHGDHDHASEGPHHGVLVELGKEEYHAEVVHDDASGTVTVYLLDGSAKKGVTTDAPHVTINVKHGDKPEQFQLPASPDKEDPQGASSRFVLQDKELIEHLDEKDAGAKLQVTIGGNAFTGAIPQGGHDHDHKHE